VILEENMSKELEYKIERVEVKIDQLQESLDRLQTKFEKHIDFIDETYAGLRSPIQAAKKFLGK
tara:strand:+ start:49 stop:240 length:192 start_codon:yes stop_codon:yes gene_type:complete